MFKGHVFLAAPDVPRDLWALVAACGGRVVLRLEASVTIGLVVGCRQDNLACLAQVRGLRIPVLRTSWVRASVAAGRLMPMKHPHVVYDPALLEPLQFTTTMLPKNIKPIVVAAIQFFGGTYSPNLTTATNIVLHGWCGGEDARDASLEGAPQQDVGSLKWRHAHERGIPCVHVSWLQDCISAGHRLELPNFLPPTVTTNTTPCSDAASGGDRANNSRGSSHEAAGEKSNHCAVLRSSCPREAVDKHLMFQHISISKMCEHLL